MKQTNKPTNRFIQRTFDDVIAKFEEQLQRVYKEAKPSLQSTLGDSSIIFTAGEWR